MLRCQPADRWGVCCFVDRLEGAEGDDSVIVLGILSLCLVSFSQHVAK